MKKLLFAVPFVFIFIKATAQDYTNWTGRISTEYILEVTDPDENRTEFYYYNEKKAMIVSVNKYEIIIKYKQTDKIYAFNES